MKKEGMFLSILCLATSLCANNLEKILYRTHACECPLELGTVELYFTQKPVIQEKQSEKAPDQAVLALAIPNTAFKIADIQQLQNIKGDGYTITVSATHTVSTLTILYDPKKISVTYAYILSIHMEHGIVLRFFDQSLLGKMRDQEKSILSVACLH